MAEKTFMSAITETLGKLPYNMSITENGAVGYKSTQHPILDMNFKTASYRNADESEIIRDFINAYNEDPILAIKWVFFARDVRGGMGERRLFRVIFTYLAKEKTVAVRKLLPLFSEYGRWDDVICLYNTAVKDDVVALVKKTLVSDIQNVEKNTSVSLLAKWMPSLGSAQNKTAVALAKDMGLTLREYRKMLSKIRAYLKIVERDMSNKEWSNINYEAVPSRANLVYNNAFLRNDEERRRAFLNALEKGEATIHGETNFPHDILHKVYYRSGDLATCEALWKALPDYSLSNTLVVADGSGSMTMPIKGTSVSAWEVAHALAIYCSERNQGEFKDKYITFSETPQLVSFNKCANLSDKINVARNHAEVANTNIKAVFELILKTAKAYNMAQEEMPRNILILSDMEFDAATATNGWCSNNLPELTVSLFDTIREKYENAGYKLPRLCFWNVMSRTGTIPVTTNELGVALVSGFSPAIVKMVMSDCLDPYENLVQTLNTERYQPVEDALKA